MASRPAKAEYTVLNSGGTSGEKRLWFEEKPSQN